MTSQNSAEQAEAVSANQEKAEEGPTEIRHDHSNNQISDTVIGNGESDNLSNSETSKPPPNAESKPSKEPTVETYTDHTGTDLMRFLTDTLQNNPKDRIHLLKIEKQLTDLVKDSKRNQHKFGPMSSYHRMLVHRVAAFFGMDHNVSNVDSSVIVSKTRTTRLPDFKFCDQIKNTPEPKSNEPVRAIIKRGSSSLDKLSEKGYFGDKSPDRRGNTLTLVESRRSKSLEEREEEYEKARARIFNQYSTSSTENPSDACANTSTSDVSMATTSSGIVVSSSATNSSPSCSHEDLKPGSNWTSTDSRLWSSTESEGSNNRPRYLRLQRQKRLPDSFDSDSARTSFTSSSMSSASGMFLTPDRCLPEQQLGDSSSKNRLTFAKPSQSSQHKSNLIILGSQLPVNTSNYGSYQPIPMQQPPLRPVPRVQSLVPSFQNQPQTNRIPNVPFNPTAVSGVPASVPSLSGSASVRQGPVLTGQAHGIGCNNGMMNHSQTFPYAFNHVSLPPAHTNGGQLAPANFSYAPSMQVPPTIPMYVNTNGGTFAPNQLTGARPMPPHQAQMIPSPYSQTPVYRPVPLVFVFTFQNKRGH